MRPRGGQSARFTVELAGAAGVELSLAVAAGGAAGALSAGAAVTLGAGDGIDEGIEATAPVVLASGLCVEGAGLTACVAFALGVPLVSSAAGADSTLILALPEADREADPRSAWVEALLLATFRDGALEGVAVSATGGDAVASLRVGACGVVLRSSDAGAAVVAAAGAEAAGAGLLVSATIA